MKSVKTLLAALVFGGTILSGTHLTAQTVEPVNDPSLGSRSVTVPAPPVFEAMISPFGPGDAPRPFPPMFLGPRSDERPMPPFRGFGDRRMFVRRFGHPRWESPVANVAETLVPTDQLLE